VAEGKEDIFGMLHAMISMDFKTCRPPKFEYSLLLCFAGCSGGGGADVWSGYINTHSDLGIGKEVAPLYYSQGVISLAVINGYHSMILVRYSPYIMICNVRCPSRIL